MTHLEKADSGVAKAMPTVIFESVKKAEERLQLHPCVALRDVAFES